mmetsp:Transcript_3880/g.8478  ORF Transcript_3880/g.8478 Transcript_3880/m.8478 type:complete len:333 (+) Transcript_3880:5507-6505(+)
MLQNCTRLVGLDPLRHHVEDIVHHRRAKLEVVVRLDTLLGHCLGDPFRRAALELAGEQVAQPALKQRYHAAQEEEPHAPAGRPEAAAGPLADRPRVEAIVDEVLEILAHTDLAHQPILVAIHARQLADVRKNILQAVCQLIGVNVAQSILNVRVDDELRQPENLAAEVEGIAEARLLALLGRERLDGLQVEVVVEVEVVDILAVDEQVEHVVALPAHLQTCLHPIELGRLEELGVAQRGEEVLAFAALWRPLVQLVKHVALEELLVGYSHLDGVRWRAVLLEPAVDERHVDRPPRGARAHVEWPRRPVKSDGRGGMLRVHWVISEERREIRR